METDLATAVRFMPRGFCTVLKRDWVNALLQGYPQKTNPLELDSATKEVTNSAFSIKLTFLNKPLPNTAEFEAIIPTIQRLHTHSTDRKATGIGNGEFGPNNYKLIQDYLKCIKTLRTGDADLRF